MSGSAKKASQRALSNYNGHVLKWYSRYLLHETEAVRFGVTGYVIHGTEFIWTTPKKMLRKKIWKKKKKEKTWGVEDSVRRWAEKSPLNPWNSKKEAITA